MPLIGGGLSLVSGLIGGNQAAKQNAALQQRADGFYDQQQGAINSMLGQAGNMQGVIGQQQANIGQQQGLLGGYGGISNQIGGLAGQAGGLASQYGADTNSLLGQFQSLMARAGQSPVSAGAAATGMISDNGGAQGLMKNAQGMLSETDPGVYRTQASLTGQDALGQLNADLASRGIASSGAGGRLGASTLAKLYSDAAVHGQQDRLTARQAAGSMIGQAGSLGLQQSGLSVQNAQMVNNQALQNAEMQNRYGQAGSQLMASLLGQQGQMLDNRYGNMLQGLQMQRGLYGDQAGLLGQQLAGLGSINGQLGNINGQYGGIASLYGNAAGMYGNAAAGQQNQMNPNPWGGVGAGLGAIGNAAGAFQWPGAAAAGNGGVNQTRSMQGAPQTASMLRPTMYMGGGRNPYGAS